MEHLDVPEFGLLLIDKTYSKFATNVNNTLAFTNDHKIEMRCEVEHFQRHDCVTVAK